MGTELARRMRVIRLVGLFAHPDDEAFAAGGSLALAAASGVDVQVVTATDGGAGSLHPHSNVLDRSSAFVLAETRVAELEASCRTLGLPAAKLLGLTDGGLSVLGSELDRVVAGALDGLGPTAVITFSLDGAYGHPDHLALTRALDRVAAAPGSDVIRILHVVFPRGLFVPVWRRLRRLPGVLDPSINEAEIGVDEADLRLDITSAAPRKRAAVACYDSQLRGGDPASFLVPGLLDDLLTEEWFIRKWGPPLPATARGLLDGL